jgi:hypothetical protein
MGAARRRPGRPGSAASGIRAAPCQSRADQACPSDSRLQKWGRAVGGKQDEEQDRRGFRSGQPEQDPAPGGRLPGSAGAVRQPHHRAEVEGRDVHEVALLRIGSLVPQPERLLATVAALLCRSTCSESRPPDLVSGP